MNSNPHKKAGEVDDTDAEDVTPEEVVSDVEDDIPSENKTSTSAPNDEAPDGM